MLPDNSAHAAGVAQRGYGVIGYSARSDAARLRVCHYTASAAWRAPLCEARRRLSDNGLQRAAGILTLRFTSEQHNA